LHKPLRGFMQSAHSFFGLCIGRPKKYWKQSL